MQGTIEGICTLVLGAFFCVSASVVEVWDHKVFDTIYGHSEVFLQSILSQVSFRNQAMYFELLQETGLVCHCVTVRGRLISFCSHKNV